MPGDAEIEGAGFVEDRPEQCRVHPGVDLDQVHAGVDQAVHRLARVARAVGADGVGIGRGKAVDHRPGAVDPRPGHGAEVDLVAEAEHRVERAVHVAHGGDAPGEIPRQRPRLDVRVGVDQARNDPAPGDVHLDRVLAGSCEPGARAHRLDAAPAHHDDRVGQGRSAAPVDQGGADQRHAVRRRAPAGREGPSASISATLAIAEERG